jgi:fumarate reductase subunit C
LIGSGKNKMAQSYLRNIFFICTVSVAIFLAGYLLSSGIAADLLGSAVSYVKAEVGSYFWNHCARLETGGRHYFLLPEKGYTDYIIKGFSLTMIFQVFFNTLFNLLFQPVFLCAFSPQVILNIIILPFSLYGAVKYFSRVPIVIITFFAVSFYMGIYGAAIEALIRHGMVCELIYILIGSAGLADLITKSLS